MNLKLDKKGKEIEDNNSSYKQVDTAKKKGYLIKPDFPVLSTNLFLIN